MSSIPGNTSTNATIGVGQIKRSFLTAGDDSDWYRAKLLQGLDYGFVLSGDGSANSLPTPDLRLRDQFGDVLAGGSNSSWSSISLTYHAGTTAFFYVDVGAGDTDAGNYVLRWVGNDVVRDDRATNQTLAIGQTKTGMVDVAGDNDWYKVNLKVGLDYAWQVSRDGSSNPADTPDLYLRDNLGNTLAGSSNYSSSAFTVNYTSDRTASYYVDIGDSDDGGFVLRWLGNDTIMRNFYTTAGVTPNGQMASALDTSSDSDWIKVQMKAGLTYGFTVSGNGTSNSVSTPDMDLVDSNGNVLVSGTNYSYSSNTITYTPTSGGSYALDVHDSGGSTGGYVVKAHGSDRIVNSVATTAHLADGGSINGKIDVATDSDWYNFDAKSGVTYNFRISGVGSQPSGSVDLVLRDANGNQIDYVSDVTPGESGIITWQATTTGRVYLDVNGDYASDAGNFGLSVVSTSPLLKGTNNADNLTGGNNNTVIRGLAGNDRLNGAGGNDQVYGDQGNDTLLGGNGNDLLLGGAGNDRLYGDAGADQLRGEAGNDILFGGADRDVFVFAQNGGTDHIADFQNGLDRIRIDDGATNYNQLSIVQAGSDVVVKSSNFVIYIDDTQRSQIDASDFLFT
ncbi:calcium-binding protein [Paracoccus pacificus]|uniref:Calcium-binding protein n=1 Tax=Paracoccus pacificus TaxID=1463598 RepID=A0ABW4R7R2_9RHOB